MKENSTTKILCEGCEHQKVCRYKNKYLMIYTALEKTFNDFPEDDRKFMTLYPPICKYGKPSINVFGVSGASSVCCCENKDVEPEVSRC